MRTRWNEDWRFTKLPIGSAYEEMQSAPMAPVQLPHDWLIRQTEDLYETADGWYRKEFTCAPGQWAGQWVFLHFDGVYMDADVLVDGRVRCTHRYGYTAFRVELTGDLAPGRHEIAVHIRHESPNSRWYSGAGIFRDVHWEAFPLHHMTPDGVRVHTRRRQNGWELWVRAEMAGNGDMPRITLLDAGGKLVACGEMEEKDGQAEICLSGLAVRPWSPEEPVLYRLYLLLEGQEERISIGFRETEFSPDRGFFLNGRPLKLRGVCLHHDLGALGAAFHEKAAERQLRLMKDMGVNAIRTSHNPPASLLLDLCDRMGLLVMDELFDMWELPKTTFDNARFFPDTWQEDVASWVRRDRRHPCVILWSIGNEIYDLQASGRGQMWTRLLMEEVRLHDDRHAPVTFASNYMPWEGAQKCADIVKIPGYNYAEKYYDAHHAAHPDWVIFGSETGSLLASRGIYHFPMEKMILSEEDLQCSALLNSNTSWGAQDLRRMLVEDRLKGYSMGQFVWSGIDYLGEPTPYHTRNCYFGQADTACFPKDSYYFYQALWTDTPMIHIGVTWDWNQGQRIDVPVMTNGAMAELFLNGRSLGKKRVDLNAVEDSLPVWQVPYEPGTLAACAYDEKEKLLCQTERSSFGEPVRIALNAEEKCLRCGSGDIAFVTVTVLDVQGRPVENAGNRVHADVSGPAVLLGMDNGDSTDADGYKTASRRLFSGKLLLMIGAGQACGPARVRVWGKGLEEASLTLPIVSPGQGTQRRVFSDDCRQDQPEEETFLRRIDLKALGTTALTPAHPSVSFAVRRLPENAMPQEITFRITNAEGVDLPCAALEQNGDQVTVTAKGDGSMYLRAAACNGYSHTRILSAMEITASGFGPVGLDPYGFIAGALCNLKQGEITSGNERGLAFARDGYSAAGFAPVDFGPVGSDEITLPVFALDGNRYEIELWDGMPAQGGRQIAVLPYQKPSIWNVYQEETYHLPEVLRGVHTLCFAMDRKIHLKGFSFARQSRAWRLNRAVEADRMYGDSLIRDADAIREIGNNVTLVFDHMQFDEAGTVGLWLKGKTPLDTNAVTVRIVNDGGAEAVSVCPFRGDGPEEQFFPIQAPGGLCTVSFVFLPGSRFDFAAFRFEKEE